MVTGGRGVTTRLLLLLGACVTVLGYLMLQIWTGRGGATPPASWGSLLVLVASSGGVILAGLPVRRFLRGRASKPLNPLRAMRTAVLAQASAMAGAVVAGWYLAQLLAQLPDFDVASRRALVWKLAALATGGVLMAISGCVAQSMCRLDPDQRNVGRDRDPDLNHDRRNDDARDGEDPPDRS